MGLAPLFTSDHVCSLAQYIYVLGLAVEFPQVATNFVPWNGIPSWFLFSGMVWNRIPSVCFYFCSTVRNSKHFSPLRSGSERNSESFLFRGTAGILQEQTQLFRQFRLRGIIFLLEMPTLICTWHAHSTPTISNVYY